MFVTTLAVAGGLVPSAAGQVVPGQSFLTGDLKSSNPIYDQQMRFGVGGGVPLAGGGASFGRGGVRGSVRVGPFSVSGGGGGGGGGLGELLVALMLFSVVFIAAISTLVLATSVLFVGLTACFAWWSSSMCAWLAGRIRKREVAITVFGISSLLVIGVMTWLVVDLRSWLDSSITSLGEGESVSGVQIAVAWTALITATVALVNIPATWIVHFVAVAKRALSGDMRSAVNCYSIAKVWDHCKPPGAGDSAGDADQARQEVVRLVCSLMFPAYMISRVAWDNTRALPLRVPSSVPSRMTMILMCLVLLGIRVGLPTNFSFDGGFSTGAPWFMGQRWVLVLPFVVGWSFLARPVFLNRKALFLEFGAYSVLSIYVLAMTIYDLATRGIPWGSSLFREVIYMLLLACFVLVALRAVIQEAVAEPRDK